MTFLDWHLIAFLAVTHLACFVAGRCSKEKAKEVRHSARPWWLRF